jgi:ethanolamine utilization protein EutN
VQPLTGDGAPVGRPAIAVDSVDAGVGDHVLVVDEGNSAAQVLQRPRGPIRTVVVGVVDEVTGA